MSLQLTSTSIATFPLPGTPTEIIERILFFAFGCDQLSTPFSPPTPLQHTSHLLLICKAITEISLPLFYHSVTILRARDWIKFFDPQTGIFVVGQDVEEKRTWVKELRINMQKDARIPVYLPLDEEDAGSLAFTFLHAFSPRLVPVEEVTFVNLRHVCLFLTKLPKEHENDFGSGDSKFRALTMGEIQREDSDDEGSIVSNGSYEMDEDANWELVKARSHFFKSLIYPLHDLESFGRVIDPSVPRLETFRAVSLDTVASVGGARLLSIYPFPCSDDFFYVEPVPRTVTFYAFPESEENDRILALAPGYEKPPVAREDLFPSQIRTLLFGADNPERWKDRVERIELVGFSVQAREKLANWDRNRKGIELVFWEEEDGNFVRAVTDEDIASTAR